MKATKTDILKKANEVVANFMKDGCLINWGDSSMGDAFRVDLLTADQQNKIRVIVSSHNGFSEPATYTLYYVTLPAHKTFADKEDKVVTVSTYYGITDEDDYFTDNKEEAIAARKIRHGRWANSNVESHATKSIEVTEKLLTIIKKREDFAKATKKNIEVSKRYDHYDRNWYYVINLISYNKCRAQLRLTLGGTKNETK